jgi:hypothetical protein
MRGVPMDGTIGVSPKSKKIQMLVGWGEATKGKLPHQRPHVGRS